MSSTPAAALSPPRFVTHKPLLVAGLVQRYDCQAAGGIPEQWQRFSPCLGNLPAQVDKTTSYGVKFNYDGDSNFDYMCGVEVSTAADLPAGIATLTVPAQKYVVFVHSGHVAGIRATFQTIWSEWFPTSGHEAVDGPSFELYGREFNPITGLGGFEIWIPIKP